MHATTTLAAKHDLHPATVAVAGLVALAVAMGIGRFAFTPIMPMMEAHAGLTLVAAGWLASINYLGYLLGALCAAWLSVAVAVRGGLLLIAVVTFAMGLTDAFAVQLVLRLLAGVASAWVLVHVSAWALEWLVKLQRSGSDGVVYAGVGAGIAASGLVCIGTMQMHWGPYHTWQLFGVLALVAVLGLWRAFRGGSRHVVDAHDASRAAPHVRWSRDQWRLMACYGALGIGYIIPATYLPDMAHRFVTNPLVFGLAWPVFGAAAALSTWIASRWLARVNGRRLWAACYVLMAAGVALPVAWPGLPAIIIAALLVGGTFMVVTMQGLREARLAAGIRATAFIAVMTAAFAIGQIVGPLAVSGLLRWQGGFSAALLIAAAVLVLAAASLWHSADTAAGPRTERGAAAG